MRPVSNSIVSTAMLALFAIACMAGAGATTATAQGFQRYNPPFDTYGSNLRNNRGFPCVAIARRNGGDGSRVPLVRGRAFNCYEAVHRCRVELADYWKRNRDARSARCVIDQLG